MAVKKEILAKGAKTVELSEDKQTLAIELALKGLHINKILESTGLSRYNFWLFRLESPIFTNRFNQARREGLSGLADDILDVADKEDDVQRARLKSDNMKWYLSKKHPEVYGDRIDLNVNQTIDIGTALKEAKDRALSTRDVTESVEARTYVNDNGYQERPSAPESTENVLGDLISTGTSEDYEE